MTYMLLPAAAAAATAACTVVAVGTAGFLGALLPYSAKLELKTSKFKTKSLNQFLSIIVFNGTLSKTNVKVLSIQIKSLNVSICSRTLERCFTYDMLEHIKDCFCLSIVELTSSHPKTGKNVSRLFC